MMTHRSERARFGGALIWQGFKISVLDDGAHILRVCIQADPAHANPAHTNPTRANLAHTNLAHTKPAWLDSEMPHSQSPLTRECLAQINAHLHGKLQNFDLPILESLHALMRSKEHKAGAKHISESESFQAKVLRHTLMIPYGSRVSYHDIAQILGTKAYRAIGSALKHNPLLLLIPCHRVVRKNGTFGNYVAGETLKATLLALESSANLR